MQACHALQTHNHARPALTVDPEPRPAARPDASSAPPALGASPAGDTDDPGSAPGVGESIGEARAAFGRLLEAHLALLRAELSVAGREIGIIAGLAAGALFLAILVAILLYVGTFLFMGEWLFGSMGWGIIHGTLLGVAIIGFVGIDLAGGSVRSYAWGLMWGAVVTIVLSLLLAFNATNDAAEWGAGLVEDGLRLDEHWAPTLVGLVVGAGIVAAAALVVGWRSAWAFGKPLAMAAMGLVAGGFVGAILASTRYDNPDGVVGLAIMIGLLTWIGVGIGLAYRRGFDPEARYASLVPRESIAAFEKSRHLLRAQWARQKRRMMGR